MNKNPFVFLSALFLMFIFGSAFAVGLFNVDLPYFLHWDRAILSDEETCLLLWTQNPERPASWHGDEILCMESFEYYDTDEEEIIFEEEPLVEPTPYPHKESGMYTITAYSCGGEMTDEQRDMNCPNGKTVLGTIPGEFTASCAPELLGHEVYFEDWNEIRVCEDNGASIIDNRIDIYLPTYDEAVQFGKQEIYVQILDPDNHPAGL